MKIQNEDLKNQLEEANKKEEKTSGDGNDMEDGQEEETGAGDREPGEDPEESLSQDQSFEERYHELGTDYNLRAEPNASSENYGTLVEGTRVKVLGEETDRWVKVEYDGQEGYVRCGAELEE